MTRAEIARELGFECGDFFAKNVSAAVKNARTRAIDLRAQRRETPRRIGARDSHTLSVGAIVHLPQTVAASRGWAKRDRSPDEAQRNPGPPFSHIAALMRATRYSQYRVA